MKKYILLCLLILSFAVPTFAQKNQQGNKEERKKEMMEFKLKFIAEEIGLQEDQKKQFNEVYTQMENERRAAFKKMKEADKKIKNNPKASEADYDKANQEINLARQQMSAIEANYDKKFEKFLSKKQLFKMKEAENKFMDRIRSCRDKKRGGNKGEKK